MSKFIAVGRRNDKGQMCAEALGKLSLIVETEDRPSLKAFKKYICNKYQVKNVDDSPLSIKEYAAQMELFESGWYAKEQTILDKLLFGG